MTTNSFILELKKLDAGFSNSPWYIDPLPTNRDRNLVLWHKGSRNRFTPLTAVYLEHERVETHYGSFLYPEIVRDLKLPEHEIVSIVYASMGLDCSMRYDRFLRNQILQALGLPVEETRIL